MSPELTVRCVGHAFVVLGLSSPLTTLIAAATSRDVSLDLGFIPVILLGLAILKRSRPAWAWAVGLSAMLLTMAALVPVLSLLDAVKTMAVFGARNPAPDLAALFFAVGLTLALPPLLLLLRPDVRRLFGTPPAPGGRRGRIGLAYLAGLLVLTVGSASFRSLIRKESFRTISGSVSTADRRPAVFAEVRQEDGAVPPRTATFLWAIAEGESIGSGPYRVYAGEASFDLPEPRSWVFLPPKPCEGPNVALVAKDGRVVRVPRRVTPANFPTAYAAAQGFTTIEDLERRLLNALPP